MNDKGAVKVFLTTNNPSYERMESEPETRDCGPLCPVAKLVGMGLLEVPYFCERCYAEITVVKNVR